MYRGRSAHPPGMPSSPGPYSWGRSARSGRSHTTGMPDPAELVRQMTEAYDAIYGPMLESLTRYWGGSTAAPWTSGFAAPWQRTEPYGRKRRHGCGCSEGDCDGCHRDDCHCRCCINDADLVVHARLGEARVVPITIENPRRRERQVRLQLSEWTSRPGSPAEVRATIVPPAEFTLGPCAERDVVIAIQVQFRQETGATTAAAQAAAPNANAGLLAMAARIPAAEARERRLPDVENCEVFYADLRIEGCDVRPVRIAVVVLPRDCGAHIIDCGCGCC